MSAVLRLRTIAAAAATAALIALWWWWRVLLPAEYRVLTILNYDLYAEVVPRLEYAFAAVARGEVPLWNPYQLAGTPFLATQQHGVLYPLNLPHLLLPLSSALSVVAILHYAIAALATAALARDLGASRLGAALAAAAFVASGSMFGRLYLPPHLYAAAWLPAQLLLARRLYERGPTRRRLVALAACFSLQFVGGYPQYGLFAAYLLVGYFLWQLGRGSRGRALRAAGAAGLALVLAAALSAAQLLPMAELMLQSPRGPGLLDPEAGRSLEQVLRALLLARPLPGMPEEGSFGVVLIFLALAGAMTRGRLGDRSFLLLAALASLLLGVAPQGALDGLARLLPSYTWFRTPSRILVLTGLFASLLAANGLRILGGASRRGVVRAALLPLLVLAAAAGWLAVGSPELRALAPWARFAWLAATLAILLALPASTARATAVAAIAVLELVLLHQNRVVVPHTDPDFFRPPAAAAAYIRARQGQARTLVAERLEEAFQFDPQNPPKTGMMAGLYAVGDYENLYPRAYAEYLGALQRREPLPAAWQGRIYATASSIDRRLLDLLGVRFVLGSRFEPFAAPGEGRFPEVFRDGDARVLENPSALPRAYLASAALPAADSAAALALLRAPDFDPRTTITLEGVEAATLAPAGGRVEIVRYDAGEVELRVESDGEAYVVLTDQHYPGWSARLDGEEVDVLRANAVFRAVRVGAGRHELRFRFAPLSFRIGAGLSLLALLAAVCLLWWRTGSTPAAGPEDRP